MTDDASNDARREPRTNMFVMAVLVSSSSSQPVKVRNMSPNGALVEGTVLSVGTLCALRRGAMSIDGRVVWSRGGRVGLRFHAAIDPSSWLPRATSARNQQRVDEMVHEVRTVSPEERARLSDLGRHGGPAHLSSEELLGLKDALEALAEELADDPELVRRHSSKLQVLDIAAQAFGKLAQGAF